MSDIFADVPDQLIDINLIDRPERPARDDTYEQDVEELADDIAAHGLINSIVLRLKTDGRYEIVAGDKRAAAHVLLSRTHVRAKVVTITEEEGEVIKGQENFRRTEMNAMEEARFFYHYMRTYGKTAEQTAHTFQRNATAIKILIRLMELPEDMQDALKEGAINKGQAMEIILEPTEIGRNVMFDRALQGARIRDLRDMRMSASRTGLHENMQQKLEEYRAAKPQENPAQGVKCVCCDEWTHYGEINYLHLCNSCHGYTKIVWAESAKLARQEQEAK